MPRKELCTVFGRKYYLDFSKGFLLTTLLLSLTILIFHYTFEDDPIPLRIYFFVSSGFSFLLLLLLNLSDSGLYTSQQNQAKKPSSVKIQPELEECAEKHFCRTCLQNQPFRTKHCSVCQICVLTFDHHCLWIGNCVGERNRGLFYQVLAILAPNNTVLLSLLTRAAIEEQTYLVQKITFIVLIGIITLNLWYLLFLQTYLMVTNLTTWELFSWNKITYLEGFTRAKGSPFNQGIRRNLQMYWKSLTEGHHKWRLPKKSPKQSPSGEKEEKDSSLKTEEVPPSNEGISN